MKSNARIKKNSYFRQTGILTSRYFKTFFNDKQSVLLTILIPLLTIFIVSAVASGDMYSAKVKMDHSINNGYPILSWQNVVQEQQNEFTVNEYGIGKFDDDDTYAYFIFEKNDYKKLDNISIKLNELDGKTLFESKESGIEIVDYDDEGIYCVYVNVDKKIDAGKEYKLIINADVVSEDDKNYGTYNNDYKIKAASKFEEIENKVKSPKDDLDNFNVLPDDFDMDKYFADNMQKLASLSQATMQIDGEDYIVINDAESLAYVLSDKSDYGEDNEKWFEYNYYLNVNVDLNDYKGIMPLGNDNDSYSGIFDGNGHIIKNFYYSGEKENVGLIGVLSGTIENLGVEQATIRTDGKSAGSLVGKAIENAKIYSCYSTESKVDAEKGNAGGLIGVVASDDDYDDLVIHTCYVRDVDVKSNNDYIGGIVGNLDEASLKACYAVATINKSNSSEYVGAITGYARGADQCENCRYAFEDSDEINAIGEGSDSNDYKEYNVSSISKDKLKEYSAMLVYNSSDDEEYGFKKDGQLDLFGGTQTGLFMLVCVAIFVGICNSIQEICKERNILKREYMSNLKLSSYVSSKLVVQALICAVQMLIVLVIFAISIRNKEIYSSGVLFRSIWIEYFITLFLLAFAADTMALVISAIVKSSSTANTFIPIILIVQIVFSGVLFDLGTVMDKFASIMISKWGIGALAISSRLNDSRVKFLLDSPEFELKLGAKMSAVNDLYMSTGGNLIRIWIILLGFIIICSVLCTVLLTNVKRDRR